MPNQPQFFSVREPPEFAAFLKGLQEGTAALAWILRHMSGRGLEWNPEDTRIPDVKALAWSGHWVIKDAGWKDVLRALVAERPDSSGLRPATTLQPLDKRSAGYRFVSFPDTNRHMAAYVTKDYLLLFDTQLGVRLLRPESGRDVLDAIEQAANMPSLESGRDRASVTDELGRCRHCEIHLVDLEPSFTNLARARLRSPRAAERILVIAELHVRPTGRELVQRLLQDPSLGIKTLLIEQSPYSEDVRKRLPIDLDDPDQILEFGNADLKEGKIDEAFKQMPDLIATDSPPNLKALSADAHKAQVRVIAADPQIHLEGTRRAFERDHKAALFIRVLTRGTDDNDVEADVPVPGPVLMLWGAKHFAGAADPSRVSTQDRRLADWLRIFGVPFVEVVTAPVPLRDVLGKVRNEFLFRPLPPRRPPPLDEQDSSEADP